MSWKRFACMAALIAITATPALAVPSLSFVDNLDGTVTLQITPSGTGSIATEIAVTADFDLTTAVVEDAVTFDTDNPGNNPQTATVTNGLVNDLANDQLFASHGSIVLNSATAVSYLTIGYTGSGTISAAGLVAEGAANFTGLTANIMIAAAGPHPGDADSSGLVDLLDLDILGTNFGASPATFAQGDFDGNNAVDLLDLDILGTHFGHTNADPATAVPEPATLLLVGFGVVAVGFRQRG